MFHNGMDYKFRIKSPTSYYPEHCNAATPELAADLFVKCYLLSHNDGCAIRMGEFQTILVQWEENGQMKEQAFEVSVQAVVRKVEK